VPGPDWRLKEVWPVPTGIFDVKIEASQRWWQTFRPTSFAPRSIRHLGGNGFRRPSTRRLRKKYSPSGSAS